VGDFNDWDPRATPLRATADSVWSVVVPLRPGRYHYTFVVDGTRWSRDPSAPRALEDDFGTPTSVITVAQR
jgi:1,4-alpha-glucan branching enzyme